MTSHTPPNTPALPAYKEKDNVKIKQDTRFLVYEDSNPQPDSEKWFRSGSTFQVARRVVRSVDSAGEINSKNALYQLIGVEYGSKKVTAGFIQAVPHNDIANAPNGYPSPDLLDVHQKGYLLEPRNGQNMKTNSPPILQFKKGAMIEIISPPMSRMGAGQPNAVATHKTALSNVIYDVEVIENVSCKFTCMSDYVGHSFLSKA